MSTDITQQAADVMERADDEGHDTYRGFAAALAAAGLLVTPEQRAVLDAAAAETQAETLYYPGVGPGKYITLQLARKQRRDAVDALRATTPISPTSEDVCQCDCSAVHPDEWGICTNPPTTLRTGRATCEACALRSTTLKDGE